MVALLVCLLRGNVAHIDAHLGNLMISEEQWPNSKDFKEKWGTLRLNIIDWGLAMELPPDLSTEERLETMLVGLHRLATAIDKMAAGNLGDMNDFSKEAWDDLQKELETTGDGYAWAIARLWMVLGTAIEELLRLPIEKLNNRVYQYDDWRADEFSEKWKEDDTNPYWTREADVRFCEETGKGDGKEMDAEAAQWGEAATKVIEEGNDECPKPTLQKEEKESVK